MAALSHFLLVALGGALGGIARYSLTLAVTRSTPSPFPWGTLVVNVSGALVIGALAGAGTAIGIPPESRAWSFLVVGALGSYTTVSSFSLQTLDLVRGRDVVHAAGNVALSFGLCLAAAGVGLLAGRQVLGG